MGYEHIETDFKDGLGTITLNRPPVNILNIAMMDEINEVLEGWQGKKISIWSFLTPRENAFQPEWMWESIWVTWPPR